MISRLRELLVDVGTDKFLLDKERRRKYHYIRQNYARGGYQNEQFSNEAIATLESLREYQTNILAMNHPGKPDHLGSLSRFPSREGQITIVNNMVTTTI